MRPLGDAWALNIVVYPREFMLMFHQEREGMKNASWFAEMRGREAGQKISEVIQRCITGELDKFAAAI